MNNQLGMSLLQLAGLVAFWIVLLLFTRTKVGLKQILCIGGSFAIIAPLQFLVDREWLKQHPQVGLLAVIAVCFCVLVAVFKPTPKPE